MRDAPELGPCEANSTVLAAFDPLPPGQRRDPYMSAGSHPDVVERVWDTLGQSLPRSCAFVAGGHPVLAHPDNYAIFAVPWGTAYALWLPPPVREAVDDVKLVEHWSGGTSTDIQERIGTGWVWGQWQDREFDWCRAALAWLGDR